MQSIAEQHEEVSEEIMLPHLERVAGSMAFEDGVRYAYDLGVSVGTTHAGWAIAEDARENGYEEFADSIEEDADRSLIATAATIAAQEVRRGIS